MTTSLSARKAGSRLRDQRGLELRQATMILLPALTDPAARDKDDFNITPPEAVRALLAVEKFTGAIWEPCCGDGAISRVLLAAGYEVVSTDLVDRGYGEGRVDFLMEWRALAPNIVGNPPYDFIGQKAPWISHSLDLATGKVALLLLVRHLAGQGRREIYRRRPPARVWIFPWRPAVRRNGYVGENNGVLDFAWVVWDREHVGASELHWLDPVTTYDLAADSLGSWHDGIAELRLRNGDAR